MFLVLASCVSSNLNGVDESGVVGVAKIFAIICVMLRGHHGFWLLCWSSVKLTIACVVVRIWRLRSSVRSVTSLLLVDESVGFGVCVRAFLQGALVLMLLMVFSLDGEELVLYSMVSGGSSGHVTRLRGVGFVLLHLPSMLEIFPAISLSMSVDVGFGSGLLVEMFGVGLLFPVGSERFVALSGCVGVATGFG